MISLENFQIARAADECEARTSDELNQTRARRCVAGGSRRRSNPKRVEDTVDTQLGRSDVSSMNPSKLMCRHSRRHNEQCLQHRVIVPTRVGNS